MEKILKEKLWAYITENNPELMFSLQEEYAVMEYLDDKILSIAPLLLQMQQEGQPDFIIEETCMKELTSELLPSRYNYIKAILEEEFPDRESMIRNSGILQYEVLNILNWCEPAFQELGFSNENEEDRFIRYAIIGEIKEYITDKLVAED